MSISMNNLAENLRSENTVRRSPITAIGNSLINGINNDKVASDYSDKKLSIVSGKLSVNDNGVSKSELNSADSKEKFKEMLEKVNEYLSSEDSDISFSYNDKVDQMVVNVVNSKTGDVIRSMPPDYFLKMMENLKSDYKMEGMLVSEKV